MSKMERTFQSGPGAPQSALSVLLALSLLAVSLGQIFLFHGAARADPDPVITDVSPGVNATAVPVDTAIQVTFSESMNTTATALAFSMPGVIGSIGWESANTTLTFTPDDSLSYGTVYTANITTDAKNMEGVHLAGPFTWSFTTIDTVSITILADPMYFGNLNAGMEGQPATVSPSVTIVNHGTSPVGVYLKADDFSGATVSFSVSNAFYNDENDFSTALAMSNDYAAEPWREILPNESLDIYHWLSVPGGTPPGTYSANFTYKAEEVP